MLVHSYPWYIKDWLLSEARLTMTLEERGLYRDLLDHFFDQGSLPTNEAALLRMAACDAKEFRRAWPAVRNKFEEREGRLYNSKAAEILASKMARKEKNATAGRSGGLAKAASKRLANATTESSECYENASQDATDDAKQTASNLSRGRARSPSPTPTPYKPPTPFLADFDASEIMERIQSRHPRSDGSALGVRLLCDVIASSGDPEAVAKSIDSKHAEYCRSVNPKYSKSLTNWVKDLGYLDPPSKNGSYGEEIDYPT